MKYYSYTCFGVLKNENLLHKWGLVETQLLRIVIICTWISLLTAYALAIEVIDCNFLAHIPITYIIWTAFANLFNPSKVFLDSADENNLILLTPFTIYCQNYTHLKICQ